MNAAIPFALQNKCASMALAKTSQNAAIPTATTTKHASTTEVADMAADLKADCQSQVQGSPPRVTTAHKQMDTNSEKVSLHIIMLTSAAAAAGSAEKPML